MNQRNSLVYQKETLQQEVLSLQRKTKVTMGQLKLWNDAAQQSHLTLEQQMKTIASLTMKLQSAESDYFAAVEELDEQKERSQSLLEQLKIQQDNLATVDRELETPDIVTKMGEVLSLYQQLMVPNDGLTDSITRFRKLSLLCFPDKGGIQETYVRPQRDRKILIDTDARNVYELEGCEAAKKRSQFRKQSRLMNDVFSSASAED